MLSKYQQIKHVLVPQGLLCFRAHGHHQSLRIFYI